MPQILTVQQVVLLYLMPEAKYTVPRVCLCDFSVLYKIYEYAAEMIDAAMALTRPAVLSSLLFLLMAHMQCTLMGAKDEIQSKWSTSRV